MIFALLTIKNTLLLDMHFTDLIEIICSVPFTLLSLKMLKIPSLKALILYFTPC